MERLSRLEGDPCKWSLSGNERRPDRLFLSSAEQQVV